MKKSVIVGAMVLAAVVAGVLYLQDDPTDQPIATTPSTTDENIRAEPAAAGERNDATSQRESAAPPARVDSRPLPPDPRLAVFQVSPDNGLIKFVTTADGKVIAEIDQDPASPGFGKRTREYLYAGDRIVVLTAYRYMSDQVEITRTAVSYKSDGSVDQFRESTRYEPAKKP